MADEFESTGNRHAAARTLAEQAMEAERRGDEAEAERLFAEAERIDPEAVVAVLQERGGEAPSGTPFVPQDDAEIAAMSRTVLPNQDAPSRAGISGRGSGADTEG